MKVAHSVCEVLRDHVVLENESVDRMYLNVYVPQLQRVGGVVWYLRGHLGQRFASTATVAPKTTAFVAAVERFADEAGVDLVRFSKHQRKDDLTQQYLKGFDADEGVVYIGRAQEGAGRSHRTTPLRAHRHELPVGGRWLGDGQPLLLLLRGRTASGTISPGSKMPNRHTSPATAIGSRDDLKVVAIGIIPVDATSTVVAVDAPRLLMRRVGPVR